MSIPFETFRIPEKTREILIQIKRKTQIEHWNVICRWCLCLSLAQSTNVGEQNYDLAEESGTEINWRTLFGEHDSVYAALLLVAGRKEGIKTGPKLLPFCRLHVHRGAMIMNRNDKLSVVSRALENGKGKALKL